MRHLRHTALTCGTVTAGLILAGCTGDSAGTGTTTTAAPTEAASATPPTGAGIVASCVVGVWRSTALAADPNAGAANADLAGGAGMGVTIEPTGATIIDFSTMEPITFTASVVGAQIRGNFTYAGRATGTMTTGPAGSASAPASGPASVSPSADTSSATTGTWQPAGDLNWDETRLTVNLTEPVEARPVDNIAIGEYTGAGAQQTGNAVDIDPFFDNGRYACSGDTLTITPDDDADLPMTLQRA